MKEVGQLNKTIPPAIDMKPQYLAFGTPFSFNIKTPYMKTERYSATRTMKPARTAGYLPKIQYWTNEYYTNLIAGINAYANGDKMSGVMYDTLASQAIEKLEYFKGRQEELVQSN
jgi:hypothetical protein